jgi:hypothetical protein
VDAGQFDTFVSFYEEMLGWRVISCYESDTRRAVFMADGGGAAFEIRTAPQDLHFGFTLPFEYFNATVERMSNAGIEFEPITGNDTLLSTFFKDPMGNRLQLVGRTDPLGFEWREGETPAQIPSHVGSPRTYRSDERRGRSLTDANSNCLIVERQRRLSNRWSSLERRETGRKLGILLQAVDARAGRMIGVQHACGE